MARSTLRASFALSLAVMASRVLGVVRESVFAALFGAGALTDAYIVAFRIPNLLRDLFAEGSLSSAFVPTFTQAMERDGRARAFELGNRVVTGLLLVTGLITLLGMLFAGPVVELISGGFAGDAYKEALTTRLARIMMPVLSFISISAAWMGMLNAQSRFVAPAMAPAIFNVVSIIGGFGLVALRLVPERAIVLFAYVTVVAALAQGLCQAPSLWRTGFRPRLSLRGVLTDPGVRRILRLMAPAVVGLAAVQINVVVNTRFAAALGDGPQTFLNNAFRLFYLPVGVFGVALATVTTTRVSEEAARGDRSALRARTAEGLRGVWMLGSASTVGLVVLAMPVVGLIFLRGRFTLADTRATAIVLQAFILGVLPYSMVKNLAPAFYAVDKPRIPMMASLVAVVTNLVFNASTYRILGAPGLALGTTLGAVANYLVLRIAYGRVIGPLKTPGFPGLLARLLLANVVLASLAYGLYRLGAYLLALVHLPVKVGGGGLSGALVLFVAIAGAFLAYTRLLARLRYPGADELANLPGKLLRKLRPQR